MRVAAHGCCAKCPWIKDGNPYEIPNGYSRDKHCALQATIASDPIRSLVSPTPVMACDESHDAHCIGWLVNQIGPGNNIGLRIRMASCVNAGKIQLRGKQYDTFEETIPRSHEEDSK